MKKTVSLFLAIVMLATMFCTAAFAEGAKTEITWMSWGHSAPQDIRNQALADAFPELAEKYVITPVVSGTSGNDVADKIRMMLASGEQLPDIFQINSMLFSEFASIGIGADVSSVFAAYSDAGIGQGFIDLCTYEGKQVAFPYCLNTLMWFYRADMMEAAGIDMDAIKDIDDVIAAGNKLRETYPESSILDLTPGTLSSLYQYVMNGSGTTYWNAEKGQYAIKDNTIISAILQDFKKLYDSGVGAEINSWTPDSEQAFNEGVIAGTLSCNWLPEFLATWSASNPNTWSARLYPSIAGITTGSENGGAMIIVNDASPNKEAAIEILSKLCFTKEGNMAMYNAGSNSTQLLIVDEALNDPAVKENLKFFLPEELETEFESYSVFQVYDFNPASALENSIASDYVQKYFRGEITVEQALEGMENDMNQQIGNPYFY